MSECEKCGMDSEEWTCPVCSREEFEKILNDAGFQKLLNDAREASTVSEKNEVWDWDESIRYNIYNENLPRSRRTYYRLPRRIGSTKLLVDIATEHAARGENVLFLVRRYADVQAVKRLLPPGVTIMTAEGDGRGKTWDIVLGDNVGGGDLDHIDLRLSSLGPRLYIDSIE